MVAQRSTRPRRKRRHGSTTLELIVAIGILGYLLGVFAATQFHELRLAKASYYRAIAIEIVDGEMEALLAGEWKAHPEGIHIYKARAEAARNLPGGWLALTREGKSLKLEWLPGRRGRGGRVRREVLLP